MKSRPTILQERDRLDFKISHTKQRKKRAALNPFHLFIKHHQHAIQLSYKRFRQATLANILTLFVIIVAFTLPAALYVLLNNTHGLNQNLNSGSQLTLYLYKNAPVAQVDRLVQSLKQQPDINEVRYISPKEGLEEFAKQSDFGDVLNSLKENPLPGVILIQTSFGENNEELLLQWQENLAKLPIVQSAQLDKQWIKRLDAILTVVKKIAWAFGLLIAIGVIFIVSNSVSLATQRHKKEIAIYELVGATSNFIRRPFLYTGAFFGLVGGIFAWFLITVILHWINPSVIELGKLYSSQWSLMGLSFHDGLSLIILSTLLGLFGAWVALVK